MTKLTVAFVREIINQQFKEEISFSRMVELLNEEANKDNEALTFLKRLRKGGTIVSSGDLSKESISQAQACNRFFVDSDYFGYAYFPNIEVDTPSNPEHSVKVCDHNWDIEGKLGFRCIKCGMHPADQFHIS